MNNGCELSSQLNTPKVSVEAQYPLFGEQIDADSGGIPKQPALFGIVCAKKSVEIGWCTHSPEKKAAVRDLARLNGRKAADCCPIERIMRTAVMAE